jgi:hypothetical protein
MCVFVCVFLEEEEKKDEEQRPYDMTILDYKYH